MSVGTQSISVMLADDHPLLLRGLTDLISAEPAFYVLGTAGDGQAALALIRKARPQIAVLDLAMPITSGLDVIKAIAAEALPVRVVLLTALISDEQIVRAMAAGVWGILLKEGALEDLIDCLRAVAGGSKWLPEEMVERAFSRQAASRRRERDLNDTLTARERQVVKLVCEGHPNAAIATELGLSSGTVRIHLHNIYMKLGVKNRTALAALVFKDRTQ